MYRKGVVLNDRVVSEVESISQQLIKRRKLWMD